MTSPLQTYRLPKLRLAAFVILHYDVESQKHIRHKRGCVEIGTAPYRDIGGIQSIFSRLHHFEKIFLQARTSIGAKIPPNRPGMTIYSIIKFQDIVSKD